MWEHWNGGGGMGRGGIKGEERAGEMVSYTSGKCLHD